MLLRLVDDLKSRQITAFLISLTSGGSTMEATDVGISSLIDTWLLVRDIEFNGERNRGLYVLKSRGMAHSNQIREFLLTEKGIKLVQVYLGPGGVLTGSSRVAQEAKERAEMVSRQQEVERKRIEVDRRRQAMEAQIAAMRASFQTERDQLLKEIEQDELRERAFRADRGSMAASRRTGPTGNGSARKVPRL